MQNGNLKPGDIIFFRSDGSFQDYFIRLVSPNYTHIGMYIGGDQFIEASIKGVVISEFSNSFNITVYRLKNIREQNIQEGIRLAKEHLGEKYSILQGVTAGLCRILGITRIADIIDNNWSCSEFIAYIIRVGIGLNICPRIATEDVLPDDLEQEEELDLIYEHKPIL